MNTSLETYRVSVRSLCEFTAKAGDLDLRFTPSPTAREGIAGHKLVTSRRAQTYQPELSLKGSYHELEVRGRADGYDPDSNRLEEIKTFRGDLDLMPANHRALHWAQVKIYGYLVCCERNLDVVELALVYFDIVKQKETALQETYSRAALEEFFNQQCSLFLGWAKQELQHRENRNSAMERLVFPHPEFRFGQRPLAEAVYKAAQLDLCLLAEAPTGIGKTLGTLFPLLKSMARKQLDKVFFLCAKTPGRRLALDTIATLDCTELRTLELVAREKSCEHPDKACHGDSCPLAQGFYDRLPAARAEAAQQTLLTQSRLRELALAHSVCPYYLSQEMARWSDLVIGDYNYYFDVSAMLYALTTANQWQVGVLVDEAHNLFDRGRAMYTAELEQHQLRAVKKQAPKPLKFALDALNRQWNTLNRTHPQATERKDAYHPIGGVPEKLLLALHKLAAAITDYLTEHPFALENRLTQFYFDVLHLLRVAELFDDQTFVADLTWQKPAKGRPGSVICLRNLVPAAMLNPRFDAAATATLFSATLRPPQYYRDVLGLPGTTQQISVASPFAAEQLQVHLRRDISTRFVHRAASIAPIANLIAEQFERRPGNYLAFFSSYDYLNQVYNCLGHHYPHLPLWAQAKRMDEAARQAFLDRFSEQGEGVGFAVLGGAFAEGIDLPGNRLIGAFIATLGLPQTNPVNELLKERMATLFGDGYNYAYLYPGLRKVVQAAGRVIRTESDTGEIFLIDDRFAEPRVRALLPDWWQ